MSTERPRVSVVIEGYNESRDLGSADDVMTALLRQDFPIGAIEVILPAAVPFIMTGLRLGIGQAVIGMVVAQMFLALSGLGKLLVNYGDFFKTDYVCAVVLVIGALMVFKPALW
mgnify:CR=1 FL=1